MKWIRWKIYPRHVQSKGIKIPSLLKFCGSLGKKLLHERVGESRIEEWSKYVVNEKRQNFNILDDTPLGGKGPRSRSESDVSWMILV